MQRALDGIIHDVALQNLPVVMALDRAGIVGEDGASMTYVANKEKSSREVGFTSSVYRMHLATNQDAIRKNINNILGREEFKSLIFT